MNIDSYEAGTPCWAQLAANDPGSAAEFYGALFGWEPPVLSSSEQEHVSVYLLRGRPVAGIRPATGSEPASWRTFVAVSDAEETARRVTAAGGEVLTTPEAVGTAGKTALFMDPEGALFAVWEAGDQHGAGLAGEAGTYAWSERITDDIDASAAFYDAVFGWSLGEPAAGDPLARREWQLDGQAVAGLLPRPPAMPAEIPPYWDVYFNVADVAATVETASGLGATTLLPPTDIAHWRIAVFADPDGAAFSVITPAHVAA